MAETPKQLTPADVIEALAVLGPQDLSVVLQFLADKVFEARLICGVAVSDRYDAKQWLEELSIAAAARRAGLIDPARSASLPEQGRWS